MSRAGRKIHPRAPWVAHPEAYSAPQQAPQPPNGTRQSAPAIGRSRAAQRMQARVDAATDLVWGDPPRIDPATPAATVWFVDQPVRVPLGWGIAFFTRQGRDCLCLLSPRGELFVLFVSRYGDVRQLQGLPDDAVRDLIRAYFPEAAR
jgi:hypothetical protein